MTDFETHPIGTSKEIRLSRMLANLVNTHIDEMPDVVKMAYIELQEHYNYQIMDRNND